MGKKSEANGMVSVTFKKNYIASRGAPISGRKGETKDVRMSEQLQTLIENETCEVGKGTPASKREKAS